MTAVQFLGATLGSLPIAVVSEGVPAAPACAGVVLAVVALALAGTLVPFTLFAFGQSRVSAEVAGAFLNLEPLVGAIAGAVVFGDPVGLVQAGGGAAILAGIALSSLPLLAGRRVARRAAAVVAAGTGAGARRGSDRACEHGRGRRARGASVGVGAGRALGAELPRRTKPPSPGPAVVEALVNQRGVLPNRFGRTPQPLNSGERLGGRDGCGVRDGKFGAGGRVAGRTSARGRGPGRGRRPGARAGRGRRGRGGAGEGAGGD